MYSELMAALCLMWVVVFIFFVLANNREKTMRLCGGSKYCEVQGCGNYAAESKHEYMMERSFLLFEQRHRDLEPGFDSELAQLNEDMRMSGLGDIVDGAVDAGIPLSAMRYKCKFGRN